MNAYYAVALFVLVFVVYFKLRPSPAEFRCARCGRWVHGAKITPSDCVHCRREPYRSDYD